MKDNWIRNLFSGLLHIFETSFIRLCSEFLLHGISYKSLPAQKTQLPIKDTCVFCEKGFSGYRSQFELITAVGGSADGVSRFHLPAKLTDDIDYVRAAALRKLVPYSLVDLFLREEPARVLGHIHGPYHAFFLFGVPARPPDNPRPTHGVFS